MNPGLLILILSATILYACQRDEPTFHSENYPNGQLERLYVTIADSGKYLNIWFYPDGTIKKHYYTRDEVFDGMFTAFHENGKLKEQINHVNGLIEGELNTFYPSGKLEESGYYEKGKMEGDRFIYTHTGKIKAVNKYLDGRLYYKKVWRYDDRDSVSAIYTAVVPIISSKEDSSGVDSNVVLEFYLPLKMDEYKPEYFRMDVNMSRMFDGRVQRVYEDKGAQFIKGIYTYTVPTSHDDSLEIKGVIKYLQPDRLPLVYDTFSQSIVLKYQHTK